MQTSINEYVYNTLVQNLWLLDNYPDYVFNFEGGVKYQWMKEYYPLEYEKIKKYIAQGRWNIAGSSWDATDPNMGLPINGVLHEFVMLDIQSLRENCRLSGYDIIGILGSDFLSKNKYIIDYNKRCLYRSTTSVKN